VPGEDDPGLLQRESFLPSAGWHIKEGEVGADDVRSLAYFIYASMFGRGGVVPPDIAQQQFRTSASPSTLEYIESFARGIGFPAERLKQWMHTASLEIAAASLTLLSVPHPENGLSYEQIRQMDLASAQHIAGGGIGAPYDDHLRLVSTLSDRYRLLPYARHSGLLS
jgi:hypothetical protein